MFIYKITINEKVYIGLDTKPMYKKSRWKSHCREAKGNRSITKLHSAMRETCSDEWFYEVIESNFKSLGKLAVAEIEYIKHFNSYKNGLNSTPGGDGLGRHDLRSLTDDDIIKIKEALGESFRLYNKNIKWANTTVEARKQLTSHLHTPEVNLKKSKTLKEFYEEFPDFKKAKGVAIKQWQEQNLEKVKEQNRINSAKGAAKVSKKLKVELESGEVLYYSSKSEFHRETGQWANTIIEKTQEGIFYNGYKVWEV